MKKHCTLLLLLLITSVVGQKKYPQNDFRNPLNIPIVLAGTFGELRTNHFHSGIDIKTQGIEGKKVYTAKEGYVSRIKISHWGYGKALYITHPNGYTTVYAHLKRFSSRLEKYIKKQQYKRKSFQIELFPKADDLPIAKNEIVAYSGNTGGSTAPHLHYEIRDTRTSKIINPLLFGYNVKDNIYPTIKGLRITPFGKQSAVNKLPVAQQISFKKINKNTYKTSTISAIGNIGLAVSVHDLLNAAPNKNGIYSLEMFANDTLVYHHNLETYAFNETKYINLLIDYAHYAKSRRKHQKTYVEKANKLSIYKKAVNRGYLTIKNNDTLNLKIVAKDIAGNASTLKTLIIGNNIINPVVQPNKKTPYFVSTQKYTVFKKGPTEIRFPKNTFYKDIYLNYDYRDGKVTVHKPNIPVNKKYTLTYFTDSLPKKQIKYAYLARKRGKYYNYVSANKKENKLYANTKYLGEFSVKYDSIAPKIYKPSFYKGQNIGTKEKLSIHIVDGLTGIKNYYATIDNQWILMEYDPKKKKLTYDLNDLKATSTKHIFKLKIEDLLGNTKTFTSHFVK